MFSDDAMMDSHSLKRRVQAAFSSRERPPAFFNQNLYRDVESELIVEIEHLPITEEYLYQNRFLIHRFSEDAFFYISPYIINAAIDRCGDFEPFDIFFIEPLNRGMGLMHPDYMFKNRFTNLKFEEIYVISRVIEFVFLNCNCNCDLEAMMRAHSTCVGIIDGKLNNN